MTATDLTRDECLRRALDQEWLARNSPRPERAAAAWDQARLWRSLALVARRPLVDASLGEA